MMIRAARGERSEDRKKLASRKACSTTPPFPLLASLTHLLPHSLRSLQYKHHADQYIASFFASSRPGSILITLSKMTAELGPSRKYLNKKRRAAGLNESAGASYFDVEEVRFTIRPLLFIHCILFSSIHSSQLILSGGDNFTWNNGLASADIKTVVYIYTRLDQSTDEGGGADGQLEMTGDYSFRDVECHKDKR